MISEFRLCVELLGSTIAAIAGFINLQMPCVTKLTLNSNQGAKSFLGRKTG
ncbi:hypothetical protein MJD09_10990 [bacterium]|nr:hypothetical protein [bacterium]